MDDPPRFLGKDVLITFGISLPAMIAVLLSEKYQFYERLSSVDALAFGQDTSKDVAFEHCPHCIIFSF